MRVAVFVDAANMFYAQREGRWQIAYEKVLAHFRQFGDVVEAHYVTGSPPFADTERVRKHRAFMWFLVRSGYTVVEKEVKVINDQETGETKRKGDLDVNFTLAVVSAMPNYDVAVLLTGDSDFEPLVRYLRASGKQVWCVARRKMTSYEMLNASTKFIDLEELRVAIQRSDKA